MTSGQLEEKQWTYNQELSHCKEQSRNNFHVWTRLSVPMGLLESSSPLGEDSPRRRLGLSCPTYSGLQLEISPVMWVSVS